MNKKTLAKLVESEERQELCGEIKRREDSLRAKIMDPNMEVRKKSNEILFTENDVHIMLASFLEDIRREPQKAYDSIGFNRKLTGRKPTQAKSGK